MIATTRSNGRKQYTVRITFAVGRDELASAVENELREGQVAPSKRVALFSAMRRLLAVGGLGRVARPEAYRVVDELCPELRE